MMSVYLRWTKVGALLVDCFADADWLNAVTILVVVVGWD